MKWTLEMKEVKEQFMQGGIKDICRSLSIVVAFKVLSWNVIRYIAKYVF
jgi:hypothetical protein